MLKKKSILCCVAMLLLAALLLAGCEGAAPIEKVSYTVEYYYNGVLDKSKTERLTGALGAIISEVADKTGDDQIDPNKPANLPFTLTENSDENIIRVYYVSPAKPPEFYHDIGKTLMTLQQENPDMTIDPESVAFYNAAAQILGKKNGPFAYYFYSTQGYPTLNEIAESNYADQIKCVGIYSTVGVLFPEVTSTTIAADFFKSIGIDNYQYTTDYHEIGWAWFDYNGYKIVFDYGDEVTEDILDDILNGHHQDIPPKYVKNSYPMFLIDKSISNDEVLHVFASM